MDKLLPKSQQIPIQLILDGTFLRCRYLCIWNKIDINEPDGVTIVYDARCSLSPLIKLMAYLTPPSGIIR